MFQLIRIKNNTQKKRVFEYLDNVAKACYTAELERVMSELENDMQKTIYLDWWYGGHLWDKETKSNGDRERAKRYRHVNDHDWKMATSFIMETVSNGMG